MTITNAREPRRSGTRAAFRNAVPARSRGTLVPALVLAAMLLPACGDFGGETASTQTAAPQQLTNGAGGVASVNAFSTTVHPLLVANCTTCHAGAGPGSPHIALADPEAAFHQVLDQGKVRLSDPATSRLVQRLVADLHHCWTDCPTDGAVMQAAIQQWADLIDFGSGGVSVGETLASTSLTLGDGIQDVGSERYSDHLIAFYEFKEGSGPVALDTSGVEPAMDLDLDSEGVQWLSSYGLEFSSGRAIAPPVSSRKLYDRIADLDTGTGQYTVEAWVQAASTDQEGPARIISYSRNSSSRNFTLGQVLYNWDFRNRSIDPEVSNNGTPSLQTYDGDQDLQDRLQHVVITYDMFRGRRIYVDARFTDDPDESEPGRLWNWDPSHQFVLGNEVTSDRPWVGQIRMVAVYEQALTLPQILQNYQAGVGKRLLMRFDVARWTSPGSVIEFQVTEFDNYSYLFCTPTFKTSDPAGYRLTDIRIAVNGEIATTGQAFRTLDTQVTGEVQELSAQCSIIPKSLGAGGDSFAIVFERLGGFENVVATSDPPPIGILLDPGAAPTEGIRNFARINETMADVTGVDPLTPAVEAAYRDLEQQLPGDQDLRSFVSSNQVGIAKLALEYCDALVETPAARDAFFGAGFSFDVEPVTAFAQRAVVFDALYDRMIGSTLSSQPLRGEVQVELDALVDTLLADCLLTTCDAERTQTIVKGTCAAVLSSAAVTIH
jgi:cytochrome c5